MMFAVLSHGSAIRCMGYFIGVTDGALRIATAAPMMLMRFLLLPRFPVHVLKMFLVVWGIIYGRRFVGLC